jgi:hypothetical protein
MFSKANKFQINQGSFQTPFSCTFYAIQLCVQGINVWTYAGKRLGAQWDP